MSRAPSKSAPKAASVQSGPPKPTDAELAILQVLWRKGPSTLSEVVGEVDSAYTTVQKFLQIMTEKGLVQVEPAKYAWRYKAAQSEDEVQQNLVKALLKKAFGGSPVKLLMQALASNKVTPEELAALKRLCEKHKKP